MAPDRHSRPHNGQNPHLPHPYQVPRSTQPVQGTHPNNHMYPSFPTYSSYPAGSSFEVANNQRFYQAVMPDQGLGLNRSGINNFGNLTFLLASQHLGSSPQFSTSSSPPSAADPFGCIQGDGQDHVIPPAVEPTNLTFKVLIEVYIADDLDDQSSRQTSRTSKKNQGQIAPSHAFFKNEDKWDVTISVFHDTPFEDFRSLIFTACNEHEQNISKALFRHWAM